MLMRLPQNDLLLAALAPEWRRGRVLLLHLPLNGIEAAWCCRACPKRLAAAPVPEWHAAVPAPEQHQGRVMLMCLPPPDAAAPLPVTLTG